MKKQELVDQYRSILIEEISKTKDGKDLYPILLGLAGGIALEGCYTNAQKGKRLNALFMAIKEVTE